MLLLKCKSTVSPLFHPVVTLRIGLKTQLEWEHPFHKIRCVLCNDDWNIDHRWWQLDGGQNIVSSIVGIL